MIGRRPVIATVIILSLFLLPSASMAGAWVPAGTDQPGFHIRDVTLSGDGAYGALVGDGGIILLNEEGDELWRAPHGSYRSVSLSGDGAILVAAGDGIQVMHNIGTVLATVQSKNFLNDVAVTADGSRIAAVADDETLRIYNITGHLLQSVDTGDDVVSVAISPDGKYIAGGTDTGDVVLFSAGGIARWTYGLSRKPVTSVAIAEGAKTIAAASEDGAVALLSRAGSLLWAGSAPHSGGVAVTADGDIAAVANPQGIRFIERDGTPAGLIPDVDASVSLAMGREGTVVAVTDGARIRGFVQESAGEPNETALPAQSLPTDPVAESFSTPVDNMLPKGDTPAPTRSPAALLPVITGLILGAGLVAAGRRCRD